MEQLPGEKPHLIQIASIAKFAAKPGARYALIDTDSNKAPVDMQVKRSGQSLIIQIGTSQEAVEITEFYDEQGVVFVPQADVTDAGIAGAGLTAATPAVAQGSDGEALIWSAGADSDDGGLLWQAGLGVLGAGALAAAAGSGSDGSAPAPIAQAPVPAPAPAPAPAPTPVEPAPVPVVPAPAPTEPAPAAVNNAVVGTIVGGPVIAENGLVVVVYQADGITKLGEGKANADGTFSIGVGSYIGVVVARVVDASDGADYLDEATGAGKDLNANLMSVNVVHEPNSTVIVNLNILTTLAYHKAVEASAGAPIAAATAEQTNAAIAQAFGLEDLQKTTVQAVNGSGYNDADGLSQGELYGGVLAALSGADAINGGDSQTTIDELLANLTLVDGKAVLSERAQVIIIEGAQQVPGQGANGATNAVEVIVDRIAPQITSGATGSVVENLAPGAVVYSATASDTGTVSYSIKTDGDGAAFSIDRQTGIVTLGASADHEAKASYTFTVVALDASGNAKEQVVTVNVANLDEAAPTITSGATAAVIAENSGAGQVVYTATSTDNADVSAGVTYSLKAGNGDAAAFTINAATGAVTLVGNPDHETKGSYAFTVVAKDAAGNATEQAVTLAVTDLDEAAPTITSSVTAAAIAENSGAGQVVYHAAATDSAAVTYSLKTGNHDDAAAFTIDATTGAVTLTGNPDHETKAGYAFTVVAKDAAGNATEQAVTLAVTNLDEAAPTITSGATATAIAENSGAGQVVYTAASTDGADVSAGVTYSLKAGNHDDAPAFAIDAATGAVTLTGNPDHETKGSYAFTVVAKDAAGNATEQAVTLAVTNLDEAAPTITSGALATAIAENSGAGQVVYTAASTDSADISAGVTYSLKAGNGDDAAAFAIDAATGAVTLVGNPDHETKGSYAFTVVAKDVAGNATEQAVTLAVTDLDETAPTITSGATAAAIAENSGAGQVVYNAAATDSAAVTYSLKTGNGDDAAAFAIDAATGAVTLIGNPDHEARSSYGFTVVATDTDGNASEKAVTLAVTDLDDAAPTITSGATAATIAENSGAGQVVYTAMADDSADVSAGVSYSLKAGNHDDAYAFTIDAATGAVTLTANPDHEIRSGYAFTVVAKDAAGNATEQAVTLAVTDLDEAAPTITSGATAATIAENSGAGQVVYTATADDGADISAGVTYSLKAGYDDDAAAFTIDAATGAVTLAGDPDHETKGTYGFTVVAKDAAGNTTEQAVTLGITDLDDAAPIITSSATAAAIAENSGAGQVVYTVSAIDFADFSEGVTYGLKADNNDDAAAFSIDATTGAVTLTVNPDQEARSSYAFTVVARDAAGNEAEQAVTLAVNDLDDAAPAITSGATAAAIAENSGAGQVVYTARADDSADVSGGVSYSLKAGNHDDASAFTIDAVTGAVTLTGNPDYETRPGYGFTVVATDAAGNRGEQAVSLVINDLADEIAPTVSSVVLSNATGAQNGKLNAGDVVTVTVNMSEATVVDQTNGSPRVALNVGGSTVYANYAGGSGTDALTFSTTIQPGQTDTNGISIAANAFQANGAVLRDVAGNAAVAMAHGAVPDNTGYVVDTTPAVVQQVSTTAPNASYNAGDVISINVRFSEAVTVTGVPTISMNVGMNGGDATWVTGSGTNTLTFNYVVKQGDSSSDLSYYGNTALYTMGGSIQDMAGNNANLTLPAPGSSGSLSYGHQVVIDTMAPSLVSASPADNSSAVAANSNIVLTFSEAMQAGSGNIVVSNGSDTRTISVTDTSQVSISGSTVTINPTTDLQGGSAYNVQIGSHALTDRAGNDYAGISNATTLNFNTVASAERVNVVFDMVEGVNSSHSGRTFQANTEYTIYIKVDAYSYELSTDGHSQSGAGTWGKWQGAENLGSDDKVVMVTSRPVYTAAAGAVFQTLHWSGGLMTPTGYRIWNATLARNGSLLQGAGAQATADLWSGQWNQVPYQYGSSAYRIRTNMPAGIMTSQGLVGSIPP